MTDKYRPTWRDAMAANKPIIDPNYNPEMGENFYDMLNWLCDVGRINQHMRDRMCEQFNKEMEEGSTAPLYFFNMHRYLIDKSNNERIKTSRAYMRVLAESEKAAVKEAGRISSDPSSPEDGIEAEWVWEVESISPLLPPGHSSI